MMQTTGSCSLFAAARFRGFPCAALGVFAALLLSSSWSAAADPHKDRCVILVSVDGLAGFYLDDPRAELPTLRRLAREGARAKGLACSFPTVTWPNHTTLVTGVEPARHGVIGNNYLDRQTAKSVPLIPDPLFDKDQIVKTPTIYDVAHQAGLVTSGIIWPATRNAKTLDWTVPDMGGEEAWPKYGTARWLTELRAADIPVDRHATWVKEQSGGVQRDWLYTRLARHVLEHHAPNLVLIHLVEVDHVQHRFGPRTPEAYWSVSYADDRLGDLVEAIEHSPYKDKTTLIVASDHGFFPIDKEIRPNVLLAKAGLIEVADGKAGKKRAWALSQGGACGIYLLEEERRGELREELARQFAAIEGIDAVFQPAEFDKIGQPNPEKDPHAPDLWLAAKSGYSFTEAVSGDNPIAPRATPGGTHGYLPKQHDLYGTLVLWGYGVQAGSKVDVVSNLDVAPTIGQLLGVEIPGAHGKPLETLLKATP
jgi:predicted AlkP superfamily pyrophosphatase or phosphodiesterase